MSRKFMETYRGYLVDHHSPAPPVITFKNLDSKDYENFYLEAKINNLMLYCKDHWGYSYYDTKIGYKHPALKTDWIAEQVSILRKHGIEFNAYYCIEYDNTVTKMHPQWATLTAEGEHLRCTGRNAKWRIPCYMTPYRQYALGQLSEIVSWYKPDSLFLDIFGKSLCYCSTCKALFESLHGFPLPETEEGIAQHTATIIAFLDSCAEGFLDDVKATLKALDSSLAITINFSSHYPKSIQSKLDYHFTEPWAGNWLSAAYARSTGIHPQLGPGNVSNIFDYSPDTVYQQAAAEIAAQGCRVFFYSEPQLPDGRLEREESKRIGVAFAEVAKYEHLLKDRTHIADICIIQSDKSHAVGSAGKVVPNAIPRARAFNRHVHAILGAMKLCDYSKFSWTVVPEQDAITHGLDHYKAVLLPQVLVMDDDLRATLLSYMNQGGSVLATDETALYDMKGNRLIDFSYASETGISYISNRTFYKPNVWGGFFNISGTKSDWGIPDTTPPITDESVEFSTKGDVLATYVEPVELLGPETWVNWGYPPPGEDTKKPLATSNAVGKGRFIYLGFDLFGLATNDFSWVYSFFTTWLTKTVTTPTIRLLTSSPDIIGVTAFRQGQDILVHVLSNLPARTKGNAPLLDPGKLIISGNPKKIRATMEYPEHTEIEVLVESDSSVQIILPKLTIHQILRVQTEEAV